MKDRKERIKFMNNYVNKRLPLINCLSESELKICQIFMHYLMEEREEEQKEISEIRKARRK